MYNQWRSQDTEVALAQGLHAAEGSAYGIEARSADHSARSAEKKISPSFFSYQDGLSWHLRTSHCKQSLLSKVGWRVWHCDSPQAVRLELDRSTVQDLVEWNQVSMVSDQQVRPCPTKLRRCVQYCSYYPSGM